MIGISKTEASFVRNCLLKKQYFLTNNSFRQHFSEMSEPALYQMIYRLRKKGILYSIMNGQYLIRSVEEWLLNQFSEVSFLGGILSYLNSIDAVISNRTAYDFMKKGVLPKGVWDVTTLEPVTRTKTLKAGEYSKKIKFRYSKKAFEDVLLYRIEDILDGNTKKPLTGDYKYIPEGYIAIESLENFF